MADSENQNSNNNQNDERAKRDDHTVTHSDETARASLRVGPYRLIEEIGSGGQGSVWLAEQTEPVRRRVAVKLLKADAKSKDNLARFESERQSLVMMDHPNIAKVFDVGYSDAHGPYFAMEYCDGLPITKYCDKQRLDIESRLKLFCNVCHAIQHAHQKGIIHRDIKPSNILVIEVDGKPVPKVIDFGLAKATRSELRLTDKSLFTEVGQLLGTYQYMSPEQAAMKPSAIDTRTDIYSLGVVLYELLVGTTPIESDSVKTKAFNEILTMIQDSEPPLPSRRISDSNELPQIVGSRNVSPSRLSQMLKGDLDWIVIKALAKEPDRRYESSSEFQNDVRRYINNDPVLARPPSFAYKIKKLAKRNVTALVTISSLFLMMFCATFVSLHYWMIAASESEKLKKIAVVAKENEQLANEKSDAAIKSRDLYEKRLARSQLFVARSYLNENRASEARNTLNKIPKKFRSIEHGYYLGQTDNSYVTLYGHTDSINSIDVHPNNKLIATGSADQTIKLWNPLDGQEKKTLVGHQGPVNCVCFSPDGKTLASASDDTTIKLWDTKDGTLKSSTIAHPDAVNFVAFVQNSENIITFGKDNWLRVWENLKEVQRFRFPGKIGDIVLSPDNTIAYLCGGTKVYAVDLEQRKFAKVWNGQSTGGLLSIDVDPFNNTLFIGGFGLSPMTVRMSSEWRLELWSDSSSESEKKNGWLRHGTFSPDGEHLVAATGRTMSFWSRKTRKKLSSFVGHGANIRCVAFADSSRFLVSGDSLGEAKVWMPFENLNKPYSIPIPLERGSFVDNVSLTISGDERLIAFSEKRSPKIQVLDTDNMAVKSVEHNVGEIVGIEFVGENDDLLVAGSSGIELVQIKTNESRWHTTEGISEINDVAISRSGKRFATIQSNSIMKIWDTESRKRLYQVKLDTKVYRVAIDDYDKYAAVWSTRQCLVIDQQSGSIRLRHDGGRGGVGDVCFSPIKDTVAIAGARPELYDLKTNEQKAVFSGHKFNCASISFDNTGSRLISCDNQGGLILWDVESNEELLSIELGGLYYASFDLEIGKKGGLIVGHSGYDLLLWNTNSYERSIVHCDGPIAGSFIIDNDKLLFKDRSGSSYSYSLIEGVQNKIPEYRADRRSDLVANVKTDRWMIVPYKNYIRVVDLRMRRENLTFRSGMLFDKSWHWKRANYFRESRQWDAAMIHYANHLLENPNANASILKAFHSACINFLSEKPEPDISLVPQLVRNVRSRVAQKKAVGNSKSNTRQTLVEQVEESSLARWLLDRGAVVVLKNRQQLSQGSNVDDLKMRDVHLVKLFNLQQMPQTFVDELAVQRDLELEIQSCDESFVSKLLGHKNLQIPRIKLSGQISEALLSSLKPNSKLQAFHLESSWGFWGQWFGKLQEFPNLREVWINSSDIGDFGLAKFRSLKNVEKLVFWSAGITDKGVKYLRDCHKLRYLQLGGNSRIKGSTLSSLNNLTELTELSLYQTSCDDNGVTQLAKLTTIKRLSLGRTNITDNAIFSLKKLKDLEWLELNETAVTDEQLHLICDLASIKELNFEGTAVTDDSLENFAKCKQLRRLNLKRTNVTKEGIARFKNMKPMCEIFFDE